MPSIVHRSALMQSRKVALVSQNFVEQANGLIEVSLTYSAAASDALRVLPLFTTDSQPPIMPNILDVGNLQTKNLYMSNFSSSQANGLLTIDASYVGASLPGLKKPLIFDNYDTQTFSMTVPASVSWALSIQWSQSFPNGRIVSAQQYINTDTYVIKADLRVEEHQFAVVGNQTSDYAAPPVVSTIERSGLIMGAQFESRSISQEFSATYRGNYSPFSGYGDRKLAGFEFRALNAQDLLKALAQTSYLSDETGMSVVASRKIEHVTPTVRLVSNVYELQLNNTPIFSKYGTTVTS
jgi:hypothetical protein